MAWYIISCGDIKNYMVKAVGFDHAFQQALEEVKPAQLSEIVEIKMVGKETYYASTVNCLKDIGFWYEPPSVFRNGTN